ncbi:MULTISPECIES: LytTR family DNA-binding domain-containing protein [unclassified Sphingobacterium]|uniref:LytR/AlgR family response regulator transcription factor n=1 Tax=unclassified Sphingobacterium TaxID=2609468 RepID=UPI001439E5B3|nr:MULTISPECIES: LytTR family DNA-binding domain-containing protein [unclassified Sphingobacterium]MBB2950824.1 DNA-binding LytR/AlgR family response regulator [Sphingobacterium sp. JUb56]NJI72655.1 response regulator transcription factor [Sphingobacterium sp. B16(2022)]
MRYIIVDDEPIARNGIKKMVDLIPQLELLGSFNSAETASEFLVHTPVDLIFLDIRMSGINGLEFARSIPKLTLIIFTTAYSQYAVDSYEVDAIDYLVKPINSLKLKKAVDKAINYHTLLMTEDKKNLDQIQDDYIIVKSDRRYFKIKHHDILFIEGLKDYVIIQLENERIITRMIVRQIHEILPQQLFLRINRSFIVNKSHINSFDNNDVFIKDYEIGIGSAYKNSFFECMLRLDLRK